MNESLDEPFDLQSEVDEMRLTLRRTMRRSLIKWTIRTTIGILLFGYLALKYEWGKWILYVWIPFAVASFLLIMIAGITMSRSVRTLERRLTEWDSD